MSCPTWKFRDVGEALQKLRDFLIGRKTNVLHQRFHPCISPRSIPPPDIPRSPYVRYSGQYYNTRHALNSVEPPIVAPIALGIPPSKICGRTSIEFPTVPTPALAYWWDGHCYFETVPDYKPPPSPKAKAAPPPPPPRPCPEQPRKEPPPPLPCEPCQPPPKQCK